MTPAQRQRKAKGADMYAVYGKPPKLVCDSLDKIGKHALKRYVERVVSKVYWIAYDCGKGERLQ
jgi:hypothetical protein